MSCPNQRLVIRSLQYVPKAKGGSVLSCMYYCTLCLGKRKRLFLFNTVTGPTGSVKWVWKSIWWWKSESVLTKYENSIWLIKCERPHNPTTKSSTTFKHKVWEIAGCRFQSLPKCEPSRLCIVCKSKYLQYPMDIMDIIHRVWLPKSETSRPCKIIDIRT